MIQFLIFYPMGFLLTLLYIMLDDNDGSLLDIDDYTFLLLVLVFWPLMLPIIMLYDLSFYAYRKRWYETARDFVRGFIK